MLSERNVAAVCAPSNSVAVNAVLYGWGATAGGCTAAQQYGGQDTTFAATANAHVYRCLYNRSVSTGACTPGGTTATQFDLGLWRAFGGVQMTGLPATLIQAVEA